MDALTGFVDFIMGIINFIKDVVAYYRAQNDGKEAEFPAFPTFGKKEEPTE